MERNNSLEVSDPVEPVIETTQPDDTEVILEDEVAGRLQDNRLNEVIARLTELAEANSHKDSLFDVDEVRGELRSIEFNYLSFIAASSIDPATLNLLAKYSENIYIVEYVLLNRNFTINQDAVDNYTILFNESSHPLHRREDFNALKFFEGNRKHINVRELIKNLDYNIEQSLYFHKKLSFRDELVGYVDFLPDPSITLYESIEDLWICEELGSMHQLEAFNWKGIIARDLFFKGLPVTRENTVRSIREIQSTREEYEGVEIFKDRNIVLLANNEPSLGLEGNSAEHFRFGKEATVEAIRTQSPEVEVIRTASSNEQDAIECKRVFIDRLINTPPPMTTIFDGHGLGDLNSLGWLLFADPPNLEAENAENIDKILSLYTISPLEFANALVDRNEKYPELSNAEPDQRDIIIIIACFSQDFIRDVYEILSTKAVQMPIMMSLVEFSQPGLSDESRFGNDFFESTLRLSEEGHTTTIGDVIDGDRTHQYTNPSLFIPTGSIVRQVSENSTNNADNDRAV